MRYKYMHISYCKVLQDKLKRVHYLAVKANSRAYLSKLKEFLMD